MPEAPSRSPFALFTHLARSSAPTNSSRRPSFAGVDRRPFPFSHNPPNSGHCDGILSSRARFLSSSRQFSTSANDVGWVPTVADPALDSLALEYPEEPYMLSPYTTPYGYFPMQLGHKLLNGQYEIVRKLGWGTNATVWLAKESLESGGHRYVAVKVMSVSATLGERLGLYHEIAVVNEMCDLTAPERSHPGYRHCAIVRRYFTEKSFHGKHYCVVYNSHGTSLDRLLRSSPGHRFPLPVVKSITSQVLLGLSFIHGKLCRVHTGHSDVKTANVLIRLDATTEQIDRYLADNPAQAYSPLPGIDILPLRSQQLPNFGLDPSYRNIQVSLTDYGSAIRADALDVDTPFLTPTDLRAPEQPLRHVWSQPIDVWAVGCMVAEMLTGESLFDLPDLPGESVYDMHLAHMYELLGPFPRGFVQRCMRGKEFIDDRGIPLRGSPSGRGSLERLFATSCPGLSAQESRDACAFVRKCLAIDPQARPTVAELLADAWLAS